MQWIQYNIRLLSPHKNFSLPNILLKWIKYIAFIISARKSSCCHSYPLKISVFPFNKTYPVLLNDDSPSPNIRDKHYMLIYYQKCVVILMHRHLDISMYKCIFFIVFIYSNVILLHPRVLCQDWWIPYYVSYASISMSLFHNLRLREYAKQKTHI